MPAPTDISGVRQLCGMVQYLSRFLPNLSGDLELIRELTRKDHEWNWSSESDEALTLLKTKMAETPVLAYYNQDKQNVLQVDSSQHGIGAVLMQEGKPVEYASRSLSPSEWNWAQIEKELLAVVYGLERFDQYTYGTKVTVENDHRPLAAILKKPLSQVPKRLQALLMRIHRYDIDFRYKKGAELFIADTLSRAHLETTEHSRPIMNVNSFDKISDSRLEEVKKATDEDPIMIELREYILKGWPNNGNKVPSELKCYHAMQNVMSCVDGIILKGEAVVIPSAFRKDIKKRLHSAHTGYQRMLQRARSIVYWPGMAGELKQIAKSCVPCEELHPRNQKETLKVGEDGNTPYEKVSTDIFEHNGHKFLVVIDHFSNFIEVERLPTTTSSTLVSCLKKQFARLGIPKYLISDCGTQYTSLEFKIFTEKCGIKHIFSSPGHHSANGKAEAAVKVAKHIMMKACRDGSDPQLAILKQRNTPRADTGLSPAQMMFGRKTRSTLPSFPEKPYKVSQNQYSASKTKREKRKQSVKKSFDKRAKYLPAIPDDTSVYFEHRENKEWILGKIVKRISDRTYIIKTSNDSTYRRNRVQIRPTHVHLPPEVQPPDIILPKPDVPHTNYSAETAKPNEPSKIEHSQDNVVPAETTT